MTDAAPANRNACPDPLARLVREVGLKAPSRIRNRLLSSVWRCGILAVLAVATACAAPLRAQDRPSGEGATLEPTEPTCADLFAAPPFDDLLDQDGKRRLIELRSIESGSFLVGVPCTREVITAYADAAGWALNREAYDSPQALGYEWDEFYEFCVPQRWFYVIPDRCWSVVQFHLREGKIQKIEVAGGL